MPIRRVSERRQTTCSVAAREPWFPRPEGPAASRRRRKAPDRGRNLEFTSLHDGLVVVDKPAAHTSHDVVARDAQDLRPAPGRSCRHTRSRRHRRAARRSRTGDATDALPPGHRKVVSGARRVRRRHRHARCRLGAVLERAEMPLTPRSGGGCARPVHRRHRSDPTDGVGDQDRRPKAVRVGPGRGDGRASRPPRARRRARGRGVRRRRVP